MNRIELKKGLLQYLFLFVILSGVLYFYNISNRKVNEFTYDQFVSHMNNNEIKEITITPRSNAGVYEIKGRLNNYSENETFTLKVPLSNEVMAKVLNEEHHAFKITTLSDPDSSTFLLFVLNVLPMLLILGVGFFFVTRQMGSANKSMDFGRSRAKLNEENNKVTFKDVAGLQELSLIHI